MKERAHRPPRTIPLTEPRSPTQHCRDCERRHGPRACLRVARGARPDGRADRPLLVAAAISVFGALRWRLWVLAVPAVASLLVLARVRLAAPRPDRYEHGPDGAPAPSGERARTPFPRRFLLYAVFAAVNMTGFATWGVLVFRLEERHVVAFGGHLVPPGARRTCRGVLGWARGDHPARRRWPLGSGSIADRRGEPGADARRRDRGCSPPPTTARSRWSALTLADGEKFFVAALEPRPGDGFVTPYPTPSRPPISSPEPRAPSWCRARSSSCCRASASSSFSRMSRAAHDPTPASSCHLATLTQLTPMRRLVGARRRLVRSRRSAALLEPRQQGGELALTGQAPINAAERKRRRRCVGLFAAARSRRVLRQASRRSSGAASSARSSNSRSCVRCRVP